MNTAFFNILSKTNNKTDDLNQTEEMKFSSESTKGSIEEIYSNETLY
jgi:hypothetical protein